MNPTLLQVVLLINVFLIGALTTLAIQYAQAHFKQKSQSFQRSSTPKQSAHLPPLVRKRMFETSQAKFQTVLDRSAAQLEHDLTTTEAELNKRLEKLGSTVLADEMEQYRAELDQLREQAKQTIVGVQAEITEHQTTLKAKLAEDITAEKQRLIRQMDMKLADAVASFLVETLPHNVDLGAQSAYLMKMLDDHKAELIRGVADEV